MVIELHMYSEGSKVFAINTLWLAVFNSRNTIVIDDVQ